MIVKELDMFTSDQWRSGGRPAKLLRAVSSMDGTTLTTGEYHSFALSDFKAKVPNADKALHGFYDPDNDVFYKDYVYDEYDLREDA